MKPLYEVKNKHRKISNSDLNWARELAETLFENFEFYDECPDYTEADLDHDTRIVINDLVNALHMEF